MPRHAECRYVMPSGLHCQSPAMRGASFCYFHGRATRPARPTPALETRIEMPSVLCPGDVRAAVGQVVQALAADRISARRATVLLQGIQMAAGHIQSDSPSLPLASGPHPRHLKE
jgi:hypothetical protein